MMRLCAKVVCGERQMYFQPDRRCKKSETHRKIHFSIKINSEFYHAQENHFYIYIRICFDNDGFSAKRR